MMGNALEPPSEGVIVERLRTEATLWINAVHLQVARINRRHAKENMEPVEITTIEVDLHFLLVALVRLQRCVNRVCETVPGLRTTLDAHSSTFDGEIPPLRKLRNVSEHIDEYNLDAGRNPSVSRRQVQTWAMVTNDDGGLVWKWLGESLDVQRSEAAAVALYRGFLSDCDAYLTAHRSEP
jgi:hypothetical protein